MTNRFKLVRFIKNPNCDSKWLYFKIRNKLIQIIKTKISRLRSNGFLSSNLGRKNGLENLPRDDRQMSGNSFLNTLWRSYSRNIQLNVYIKVLRFDLNYF